MSNDVVVVIGPGSIGQAIARRVSAGKHVLLADLRQENADAAAKVLSDAGFDVKIEVTEGATLLGRLKSGNYEMALLIWSGRPDPDGNITIWMSCGGFVNWGHYCNKDLDGLFEKGAALTDPGSRVPVYRQILPVLCNW